MLIYYRQRHMSRNVIMYFNTEMVKKKMLLVVSSGHPAIRLEGMRKIKENLRGDSQRSFENLTENFTNMSEALIMYQTILLLTFSSQIIHIKFKHKLIGYLSLLTCYVL